MNKHFTIIYILNTLKEKLDFDSIEITDYWDGDLMAIGLQKDNRVVYISTVNIDETGFYYYEFELVDKNNETLFVLKREENVEESKMVEAVQLFFEEDIFVPSNFLSN